MNVAVIPARGGSKRIPRKNIRPFLGKPIMAYSIEAALESGCFDRVVVSTDDPEIADVARRFGAETPFERPGSLADDITGTKEVTAHAIEWLRKESSGAIDYVACIYATAPFLQPATIQQGLDLLRQRGGAFAITMAPFGFPPQRALRLSGEGVAPLFPEYIDHRSQDLEPAYQDAGQLYWGTPEAFCGDQAFFGPHTRPILLPPSRVQDIDTEADWERAEQLYRLLNP